MTKSIIWILGMLVLTGNESIVSAKAIRQCTTEECACGEALRQNTIEALEAFLRKYPDSVQTGSSACGALAVPPAGDGVEGLSTKDGKRLDPSPADLSFYGD